MTVGPQYQSQLALLAGALGHGLDASTGLQLYQQTIQAAATAKAQRQQEISDTLGKLADLASGQAQQGADPASVSALVHSAEAGLPMSQTQAVKQGVHGILGSLSNYTAPVDPMAQAQLQGQLLQNQKDAMDLQSGGTVDLSKEQGIFGPEHQALVQNLTQQYFAAGMPAAEIRSRIINQLSPEFQQDIQVPVTPTGVPTKSGQPVPGGKFITQKVVAPGTPGLIDQTISATLAQIDPTYMTTHPGGALAAAAGITPPAPPQPAITGQDVIGALNQTPNNFGIGLLNPNANVSPPPGTGAQGDPWANLFSVAGAFTKPVAGL